MSIAGSEITVDEVDASIARVIASAESIWDEWAWQVENKTWLVGNRWSSWEEMRHAAYGSLTSISAPRAERPELVARFRRAGLTQQQTADTLGIGERTVKRHDEPTYAPREPKVPNGTSDEVVDAEVVDDTEDYVTDQADLDAEPAPTKPAAPRRTPLPDSIRNAVIGAETKLTTLRDLTRDDRWSRNAEEVAPRLRNDLRRLSALLEQVTNALPTSTEQDSDV